ncbi:hypothetical protein GCM10010971_40760 [Silvimonas amylolytica]|uniref:Nidogen G2 beta-barrel domain-containing protein n=2 Tax=Silvimonas amylolytica TaxID=449663 RepID=A0ABQ2PRI6_9NEIS|nr:hypothetical protein GCM10010971_40760 [Silvimonas amylolytica]
MGNVYVRIPERYALLLQYEKNQHGTIAKFRGNTVLARKIAAFRFDVTYPKMESTPRNAYGYHPDNVGVGVNSNSNDGNENTHHGDVHVNYLLSGREYGSNYSLVGNEFGMKKYINSTSLPGRADKYLFTHNGADGHIDVYITCSDTASYTASCEMSFDLPEAMRSEARVLFRIGMVNDWMKIKASVSDLISGFSVNQ